MGAGRRRIARAIIATGLVAGLAGLGGCVGLFAGSRPDTVGLRDGRLQPPGSRPNNVSSLADATADAGHYIAPLRPPGDLDAGFARLKQVIRGMERATVVRETVDYLHVEFASKTMGFVDDAEFHLDRAAGVIQVRSAARLGYRDFDVNRKRVEAIRAALARPS
jgi:uncharacterized protein (DUF1499 family)